MLSAGDGPGGVVLAEGIANFATLCLIEKMLGEPQRQTISRQIEAYYAENRGVTSERPIAKSEFFRPGDVTVIYDKGGWVFWMMRNLLGRQQMYSGLTSFIKTWHSGLDHPLMEDFAAHMR
jgi:ABC-2 type transport system permease protein